MEEKEDARHHRLIQIVLSIAPVRRFRAHCHCRSITADETCSRLSVCMTLSRVQGEAVIHSRVGVDGGEVVEIHWFPLRHEQWPDPPPRCEHLHPLFCLRVKTLGHFNSKVFWLNYLSTLGRRSKGFQGRCGVSEGTFLWVQTNPGGGRMKKKCDTVSHPGSVGGVIQWNVWS